MQNRVAALSPAAADILHTPRKAWRVTQHRIKPVLRPRLAHLDCRLYEQHRTRVQMHVVADHIAEDLGPSDLRGLPDPRLADRWVRHRIHDAALKRLPVSPPLPRRCARLRTQDPE